MNDKVQGKTGDETNIRPYETYKKLYHQLHAARSKVDARREEAKDAGDKKLSKKLRKEYDKLGDELVAMRRAEIAHLTSGVPSSSSALAELRGVVKEAEDELEKLENVEEALAAAQRILGLVTRFIKLFS